VAVAGGSEIGGYRGGRSRRTRSLSSFAFSAVGSDYADFLNKTFRKWVTLGAESEGAAVPDVKSGRLNEKKPRLA
jgi:hypothetical protein